VDSRADACFTRTTEGQVAQHRFHDTPLVWLEGPSDFPMFLPLADELGFTIMCAGGVVKCRQLANAMVDDDLPFVVVMDGDYTILGENRHSQERHDRVIVLRRHSIENYCAEPGLVEALCRSYSEGKIRQGIVGRRFEHLLMRLEHDLWDLVVLDIASEHTSDKVAPKSIKMFLRQQQSPVLDEAKVQAHVEDVRRRRTSGQDESAANDLLRRFVERRRFIDALKGHWVLELIQWFVSGELKDAGIRVPALHAKALRPLLAPWMWRDQVSRDHADLRKCLTRAIHQVRTVQVW